MLADHFIKDIKNRHFDVIFIYMFLSNNKRFNLYI
jgi:hypothetical protein